MWKFCLKYKKFFLIGVFFIALTSFIQISFEFLKGAILDSAIEQKFFSFMKLSFLFFFAFLLKAYTHFLYTRFYFKGKISVLETLRHHFIRHLLNFTYPFFIRLNKGDYLYKYTKEMDMIENGLFQSWYGFMQIIFEVIFAFSALIFINYKLALFSFLLLLLPVFSPKFMEGLLSKYQKLSMEKGSSHISKISEWINNFEIIRNYSAVENFRILFDKDNKNVYKINLKNDVFYAMSQSLSKILTQISLLGIISLSAFMVAKGEITVGALIISVGIMEELQSQVIYIAYYIQQLLVTKVPVHSLNEFLRNKGLPEDRIFDYKKITEVQSIDFQDLSFSYHQDSVPLFEHISLSAKEKGLYLVQGESGSGKSTLMNLLLNYYKTCGGNLTVNNIDVNNIDNLTELITIFRQEAVFFDSSLRENLNCYQDIADIKLIETLRKLRLDKFATKTALDEPVLKNGSSFSGGEARRLNLARSLLRKSDILILDEPFANVDEDTVNIIVELISTIKDRYVFLITHQLPSKTKLKFQNKLYL